MPIEKQLKYPLDATSKAVFRRTMREMLPEMIADVFWDKVYYYSSTFEAIDVSEAVSPFSTWILDKTGTAVPDADVTTNRVRLHTGTTSGNRSELLHNITAESNLLMYGRRTRFRTQIDLSSVTAVTAYVTSSGARLVGTFGFKIVNNELFGVVTDSASAETLTGVLATLSVDTPVQIEARWDSERSISFYIAATTSDAMELVGVLRSGFTSVIANQTSYGQMIYYRITTDEAVDKHLLFSTFEFMQDIWKGLPK